MQTPTVGVLGGGQLGRMMAESAHKLGMKLIALDPKGPESPAGQVTQAITGSFKQQAAVLELAEQCDILTVEIEHVDCAALEAVEALGKEVHPSPATIRLIQDKYLQKEHMRASGIPVSRFLPVASAEDIRAAVASFGGGYPVMLKSRMGAYDGRGNAVISEEGGIDAAVASLGGLGGASDGGLYVEEWVPFSCELAVMVARGGAAAGSGSGSGSSSGEAEVVAHPVVQTVQRDNICHTVVAPAQVSTAALTEASRVASAAVASLSGRGIFGVELFLLPSGAVLFNEIAPRPHNSGHYTIEACGVCQFEQHLRCVAGLPLGDPSLVVGASVMVNVLGQGTGEAELASQAAVLRRSLTVSGATLHWYGKAESRVGRKMGHITIVADNMADAALRLQQLAVPLPGAAAAAGEGKGEEAEDQIVSISDLSLSEAQPVVGVIMGSDSDLPCMSAACAILELLQVPFEVTVVSAHRTPSRMYDYARDADGRGIRVIIAGAGGAAHLPGMVAALTNLPVIGVPVKTSTLSGKDSLLSIVQMPRGVPVATVAIGNAKNAGLLAIRMLAVSDAPLAARLEAWRAEMEEEVLGKAANLEGQGWAPYLAAMPPKK